MTIDMNGEHNLVPSGLTRNAIAVQGYGVSNLELSYVTVLNSSGQNAFAFDKTSTYLMILFNTISVGGTALVGNTNQTDWTAIYTEANHSNVSHNKIVNSTSGYPRGPAGGIELHGSYNTAIGNDISYGFPCFYANSQFISVPQNDVTIADNHCRNAYIGIVLNKGITNHLDISNNDIYLTTGSWPASVQSLYGSYGVNQYNSSSSPDDLYDIVHYAKVVNNTITEVESSPLSRNNTIGIRVGSFYSSIIAGNTIQDVAGPGIQVYGSPYGLTDLFIDRNTLVDFGSNTTPYGHYGIELAFSGRVSKCTAPCAAYFSLDRVTIIDNVIALTSVSATASAFYLNWDQVHSSITGLVIKNNSIRNITHPRGGLADTSGTKGVVRVTGSGASRK